MPARTALEAVETWEQTETVIRRLSCAQRGGRVRHERHERCCYGIRESLVILEKNPAASFVEGRGSRLRGKYQNYPEQIRRDEGNTSPVYRRTPYRSEARNHS